MSTSRFFAGIGSRETPSDVISQMIDIGAFLATKNYTLRSGAARGADTAFETGCSRYNGSKEIFIPWNGFNGRSITEPGVILMNASPELLKFSSAFHPNWAACSDAARRLHSRNALQVLGHNLATPVDFVICWTPNGKGSGGTGQAIRIARANNIPVFDLGDPNFSQVIESEMKKLI